MKKTLSVLATVIVLCMTSCVLLNPAQNTIVGKTYSHDREKIYFNDEGEARTFYKGDDGEWRKVMTYDYEIEDNKVKIIYNDEHSIEEKRGTVSFTFTYNQKEDTLTDEDGNIWRKYNE